MRKLLLNDKTSYAVKTVSVNAGMVGKKKIMAVLLAVCMVFAYMPMASAANAESGEAGSGEKVACDTGQISIYDLDLPDDSEALQNEDILLEKYMMKKTAEEVSDTSVRSGMKKSAAKGVNAKADSTDCLSTNSKRVYNNLKKKVKNIAEGKATSSMISIKSVTSASDATEDVPVVRSDYSIAEYNSFISGGRMDLDAFLELNNIDLELVVKALLADIPFELYWFDKVSGYSYSLGTNLTAQTIEYDNAGNPAKKRLNNVDLNIR